MLSGYHGQRLKRCVHNPLATVEARVQREKPRIEKFWVKSCCPTSIPSRPLQIYLTSSACSQLTTHSPAISVHRPSRAKGRILTPNISLSLPSLSFEDIFRRRYKSPNSVFFASIMLRRISNCRWFHCCQICGGSQLLLRCSTTTSTDEH